MILNQKTTDFVPYIIPFIIIIVNIADIFLTAADIPLTEISHFLPFSAMFLRNFFFLI